MSHQVETMAYANEVPWHGLGARVDTDVTPDEMLQAAGLNWEIIRTPIYARVEGKEIKLPGRRAMIRSSDNKVMTVTGQDWKPLQNRDLLNFFKDYASAGGATLETAGSLRGGAVVWGLANLNDGFEVTKGDRVGGYLLFTSPHKVGASIKIRTTTVRVVCANTMAMAEGGGTVNYTQNHLKAFDMDAAKAAVERAHESLRMAGGRAKQLNALKLGVADRLTFLAKFFGPDTAKLNDAETHAAIVEAMADSNSKLAIVNASVESAPGAEPETGWGILNGVTHYADHVNGRSAASRMFRSWVGDMGKVKTDVEAGLLELI